MLGALLSYTTLLTLEFVQPPLGIDKRGKEFRTMNRDVQHQRFYSARGEHESWLGDDHVSDAFSSPVPCSIADKHGHLGLTQSFSAHSARVFRRTAQTRLCT